ncbi:hypothetical protein BC567DRAFT_225214, partial [Phyllosticta citribraziliensis]
MSFWRRREADRPSPPPPSFPREVRYATRPLSMYPALPCPVCPLTCTVRERREASGVHTYIRRSIHPLTEHMRSGAEQNAGKLVRSFVCSFVRSRITNQPSKQLADQSAVANNQNSQERPVHDAAICAGHRWMGVGIVVRMQCCRCVGRELCSAVR